jgi:hypothetical protein
VLTILVVVFSDLVARVAILAPYLAATVAASRQPAAQQPAQPAEEPRPLPARRGAISWPITVNAAEISAARGLSC